VVPVCAVCWCVACASVRTLERLGYQVTIQALNPGTSQPLTATA
jgi:hypothetical protein